MVRCLLVKEVNSDAVPLDDRIIRHPHGDLKTELLFVEVESPRQVACGKFGGDPAKRCHGVSSKCNPRCFSQSTLRAKGALISYPAFHYSMILGSERPQRPSMLQSTA